MSQQVLRISLLRNKLISNGPKETITIDRTKRVNSCNLRFR
uniref:Uncharacterized protein n=1 Tax=Rhizophora mucronata TaxID=61149 RepID=A0A2P2PEA8_RHIMU